jgi:hypothetical protein
MTLSGSIRAERNDYDAVLGRQDYDTYGGTLQWEWQPSAATIASIYYGYDRSTLDMANINEVALTPDPSLGGATYALEGRWWAQDAQRNHYLGATLDQNLGRVRLQLAGNYTDSRGTTDLSFASPAALAWPTLLTGNAFPAMQHEVLSISASLHIPINDQISLRVFDLYERGRLSDWHYQGFDASRVYDHRVYVDGGPEHYSDNLVGLMIQIRL